jgi:diacylglycerol kinase (ATP)
VLRIGTTNDFARALAIPRNLEKACDIIVKQYAREIDSGNMNDYYFINIADGGSMTELTYEVPRKLNPVLVHAALYFQQQFGGGVREAVAGGELVGRVV